MRNEREKLEREIAAARAELKEATLEQARLIQCKNYLKERNAPQAFLARYRLDILENTERINRLNERIHMLENLMS